ncbi:low temperature requirement protein A [Actinoallomurus rhizosphaericola]|uniref:low temperature requirement protein A n=1 Tax=Actinoallomurus rhizosphaericola TaxID=2952536 RepID=UPI0020906DDD|nr:low temperature requirement protein A [Actinoallomurus rhizosphaericola]MCO5993740.1 low temperature requirement protein A [Actinoallomurus rhizosphaericola]
MDHGTSAGILRSRRDGPARVTYFELFFDLVFVFAVTQLSHRLLKDLTVSGAAETLLLLLAVWWAWMYTSWTTNWFNPDHPAVRLVLIAVMLSGLLMSTALPEAFEGRGLWFAGAYVAIQVGRTAFVTVATWRHELGPNFQRIMAWETAAGMVWLAGGLGDHRTRPVLWLVALAAEYVAPWFGYRCPGLGRSTTAHWTIDGSHMAERCQLFVIIALGESLLVTGSTFGNEKAMGAEAVTAFAVAFLGSVAMWWIYFDRSAEAAATRIANAADPGRLGRSAYTFSHVPLVAGIIVSAVADELVVAHPHGHMTGGTAAALLGGPALFVAGHALFKRAVFGHFTAARVLALLTLAVLTPLFGLFSPLGLAVLTLAILGALAGWEVRGRRVRTRPAGEAA